MDSIFIFQTFSMKKWASSTTFPRSSSISHNKNIDQLTKLIFLKNTLRETFVWEELCILYTSSMNTALNVK
jgi:hypothetical protein